MFQNKICHRNNHRSSGEKKCMLPALLQGFNLYGEVGENFNPYSANVEFRVNS